MPVYNKRGILLLPKVIVLNPKDGVLAYCNDVMCVENTFKKGAIGALHNHPHTQITYVASGKFEFTIDGEVHTVSAGDTLLKQDGVMHGCTCLEDGILIDIFTPMREDFL